MLHSKPMPSPPTSILAKVRWMNEWFYCLQTRSRKSSRSVFSHVSKTHLQTFKILSVTPRKNKELNPRQKKRGKKEAKIFKSRMNIQWTNTEISGSWRKSRGMRCDLTKHKTILLRKRWKLGRKGGNFVFLFRVDMDWENGGSLPKKPLFCTHKSESSFALRS